MQRINGTFEKSKMFQGKAVEFLRISINALKASFSYIGLTKLLTNPTDAWNSMGMPRPLAPWVFRSCCLAGFLAWGAKRVCPGGCLGVGKGWLRPELSQVPIRGCFPQKSMREYLCPGNQIFWLKSPEVQGPRRNTPARRPIFFDPGPVT